MSEDALTAALNGAGLAGPDNAAPGRRCKVGRILDTVTPANRATIVAILNSRTGDPDYQTLDWLASALERGGHRVAASLLSRHRSRGCICTTYDKDTAA